MLPVSLVQWLQGKVFTTNGRMETGSGVRTCATRQSSVSVLI